jgi:hypothetical protein
MKNIINEDDYSQGEVEDIFIEACIRGRLDFVKYFMHDKSLKHNVNLHEYGYNGLMQALNNDHHEIVDYLMPYENIKPNPYSQLNDFFLHACKNNLFKSLKVLIHHATAIKFNPPYKRGFSLSCKFGHIDNIILLTSYPHICETIGNEAMLNEFDLAAKSSNDPVVKFFLSQEHLNFKINPQYYFLKDVGFNPHHIRVKLTQDSKPFLDNNLLKNDLVTNLSINEEKEPNRSKKRLKI